MKSTRNHAPTRSKKMEKEAKKYNLEHAAGHLTVVFAVFHIKTDQLRCNQTSNLETAVALKIILAFLQKSGLI